MFLTGSCFTISFDKVPLVCSVQVSRTSENQAEVIFWESVFLTVIDRPPSTRQSGRYRYPEF